MEPSITYTCVIVDDEAGARATIRTMINQYCPLLEVAAECASVEEALPAISQHAPQLVFLDLKLGDRVGFEIVDFFDQPKFEVIFITAYSDQRKNALDRFCLQYLTKPIDIDLFVKAYQRFISVMAQRKELHQASAESDINQANAEKVALKRLVIPSREKHEIVDLKSIYHIESEGNYSRIYLKDRTILTSKTLKYYDDLLHHSGFFRVHRSHLVNIQFITSINFDNTIEVADNWNLPLSSSVKKGLLEVVGMK